MHALILTLLLQVPQAPAPSPAPAPPKAPAAQPAKAKPAPMQVEVPLEAAAQRIPVKGIPTYDVKTVTAVPGKPERWVRLHNGTRVDRKAPYMRVYYWPPDPESAPVALEGVDSKGRTVTLSAGVNLDPVYFAVNSTSMLAPATNLKTLAAWLHGPDNALVLRGFADVRGSKARNMALCSGRAEAVKEALVALGADADKISVQPMGTTQGRKGQKPEEKYWESRRVDLQLVDAKAAKAASQKSLPSQTKNDDPQGPTNGGQAQSMNGTGAE